MKTTLRQAGILVALLGTAIVTTAAVLPAISIHPESRIWVDGTSTVRSYSCEAAQVLGSVDADANTLDLVKLEGAVRGARLTVAVAGLECGNSTMNNHLRKALKASEHAGIEFQLSDYLVVVGGNETKVKLNGTLEIAGQARPFTAEAVASAAEGGALRVKGSKEFLMSEFGVKPPSLMMGTMKVADKVKVGFDVVLRP